MSDTIWLVSWPWEYPHIREPIILLPHISRYLFITGEKLFAIQSYLTKYEQLKQKRKLKGRWRKKDDAKFQILTCVRTKSLKFMIDRSHNELHANYKLLIYGLADVEEF